MCSPWVFRALQVYSPSSAASTVAKASTPPRITALGLILLAGPPGTNHRFAGLSPNSRSSGGTRIRTSYLSTRWRASDSRWRCSGTPPAGPAGHSAPTG